MAAGWNKTPLRRTALNRGFTLAEKTIGRAAGQEVRAGRDAGQCVIALNEPRISGVHASLKLEGGQLYVRDENSNNGTLVNGNRLSPGIWSPVPPGSIVRFGPIEFSAAVQ